MNIKSDFEARNGVVKKSLMTIPQLAAEAQIPVSWLYERSRREALPGQCRFGKYVRVNRDVFFAALRGGKIN